MRRHLFALALIVAALITLQTPPAAALSEAEGIPPSLEELKAKRQEASRQLQGALNVEQAHRDKLLSARVRLAASEKRIDELADQLDQVTARLEETRAQRDKLQRQVDERRQRLGSWLRLMYEDGSVSYLEVLLSATDFVDFVERLELITQVINANVSLLREVKSLHEKLVAKERQLAAEEANLRNLKQAETVAAEELRRVEAAQQKALGEAMAVAGEYAAAMALLDRTWAEALPALERFLAGFPSFPWDMIEPDSVNINHDVRTIDIVAGEAAVNQVFPLFDPVLGQVRLSLRPGEAALTDVAAGLFRLTGRLEPGGGNRVRYVPVALEFLGIPVGPDVLDEIVREHDLYFDYNNSGLPLRLKTVEVGERRMSLRFTW